MHYEISVAESQRNGKGDRYRHLFATHPRSIKAEDEAKRVFRRIARAFPEPSYSITVTKWDEQGSTVKFG